MPRAKPIDRLLHEHTGHLIRRLHQISVAFFLDTARREGLTPTQYAALAAIGAMPGIDQATMAGLAALDRSTAGSVLAKLARRGLVSRRARRGDQRSFELALTARGRRVLAALQPRLVRTNVAILSPLSVAERRAFIALMARIVDANNAASRVPLEKGRVPTKRRG
jgi:DNA-binding MarR family transcriptional regulator